MESLFENYIDATKITNTNTYITIYILPPEIWELIFYNLDAKTCKILPQICKFFYDINKNKIFQSCLKHKLCKLNIDFNPISCGALYYHSLPNGLKHYIEISFYPNDQIFEIRFWDTGLLSGYNIGYYINGQLWWEKYWLYGKRHNKEIMYFRNNIDSTLYPKYIINWNNDKRHGLEQNWLKHDCLFPSNCTINKYYLNDITNWNNDKQDGNQIYYNCNGTIRVLKTFDNDKLVKEEYFY